MTSADLDPQNSNTRAWTRLMLGLMVVLAIGGGVAAAVRASSDSDGAYEATIPSDSDAAEELIAQPVVAVEPDVAESDVGDAAVMEDAAAPAEDESPAQDAAEAPPVRLAVAGDVGTGNGAEYATAESMDRFEQAGEYDALLLLGDNVYPDGNPDELDKRVFTPFAGVLDGATQLLPVLGNHDNDDGYGDAQVAAFGMPGRWYSTVIGNTLIVSLDSNRPDDADQRRWLDDTLAASAEPWTIVEMHHAPYSGGEHGSDEDVRDAFGPIFERYGVQLVLTGHEHDYQRTEPINGVTYVVSGAASLLRDTGFAEFTEVALSVNQFTEIVVSGDRLELRAINHDDDVIDEVTMWLDS